MRSRALRIPASFIRSSYCHLCSSIRTRRSSFQTTVPSNKTLARRLSVRSPPLLPPICTAGFPCAAAISSFSLVHAQSPAPSPAPSQGQPPAQSPVTMTFRLSKETYWGGAVLQAGDYSVLVSLGDSPVVTVRQQGSDFAESIAP